MDRNLWWGVRKAVGSLVALRKESVDRNGLGFCHYRDDVVALRKESVDRNGVEINGVSYDVVALRKESVDRNGVLQCNTVIDGQSLSARRAWIEILSAVVTELLILCRRSPQGERG